MSPGERERAIERIHAYMRPKRGFSDSLQKRFQEAKTEVIKTMTEDLGHLKEIEFYDFVNFIK